MNSPFPAYAGGGLELLHTITCIRGMKICTVGLEFLIFYRSYFQIVMQSLMDQYFEKYLYRYRITFETLAWIFRTFWLPSPRQHKTLLQYHTLTLSVTVQIEIRSLSPFRLQCDWSSNILAAEKFAQNAVTCGHIRGSSTNF